MGFKNIFSSLTAGAVEVNKVVGIDIGSSSMKVVELQDKKGVITLTTYGELQLGPYANDAIGKSVVLEVKEEQEALADVIRESAVTARQAVFAMPLSSSFVTNVSLDTDANSDLSAMVRVEARKVIPASLSEVTLDWAEVGTAEQINAKVKKGQTQKRNVLIAAIQNNALDRFRILMRFAGLEQPPTEIECFSTVRALFSSDEANVAIIDIGANSSKLYISQSGLLMRMHRVRAGGAVATEKIAEELNLSFDEAELKKQTTDRKSTDFSTLQKIHADVYSRPFREFKQVIAEHEQKNNCEITTVYLAGGGAVFPGVDALLSSALSKEIVLSNPFKKVAYPAFMQDTIEKIGPTFTVALGAAIRSFE